MNTKYIKEQYHRFKQWQEKPYEYKLISDKVNHCNNCGNDFTGNYCPICSQKAGEGPISWGSVQHSFLDIWGLGSRSLPRTIWHLLLRPGHLICDYIEGKRQVCFPPVKMLFILTVVYAIFVFWLFPEILGISVSDFRNEETSIAYEALGGYVEWTTNHFSWAMLFTSLLAILPTWILFRYAPRYPKHTLPEGFFIQVLFSVIIVAVMFLLIPLRLTTITTYNYLYMAIVAVYYIVGYMQLFGYNLWSTLWRSGFVLFFSMFLETAIVIGVFGIDFNTLFDKAVLPQGVHRIHLTEEEALLSNRIMVAACFMVSLMSLAVGAIANIIATNQDRKLAKLMNQANNQ